MKKAKMSAVQKLNTCSLLASLTVLFQISIGVLPGLGHILSAFGVLPISLAVIISPTTALMSVAVTAWLTFVIMPYEFPLFIFCIAPLGLALGISIYFTLKYPLALILGTLAQAGGMLILAYSLGMPAFGTFLFNKNYFAVFLFYVGFSFVYCAAWLGFIKKMKRRLKL